MKYGNMRKIIAVLMLAAALLGCGADDPDTTAAPQMEESTAVTVPDTQAATAIPGVSEQTEPEERVTVYAGAVEDYLLPLEDFSWEREHEPEYVMIHFTSAVVNNREDPYNMETIRNIFISYGVSIHYMIDRDGTIRCYVPEDRVAWHAGKGSYQNDPKYTNAMNHYAIGIELVGIGSQSDMAIYLSEAEYKALDQSLIGFTRAQYDALKLLVEDICVRYDIPMDRSHVIGHQDYSPAKTDPGELFDWPQILP